MELSNFGYFRGDQVSHFGNFRALGTPGGDLGPQRSILGPKPGESLLLGYNFGTVLGHFWDLFLRYFLEDLWITFLTILGWFQAAFWGNFRHILDKKRACTKS